MNTKRFGLTGVVAVIALAFSTLADGATSVENASAITATTPVNPKRFLFIYILHGWIRAYKGVRC